MDGMSGPKYQFKGVWIPKEIFEAEDITATQKILLAEIDALDNGTGCFASNAFLAKRLQTTQGTVAKYICELRAKGYIIDHGESNGGFARRSVRYRVYPEVQGGITPDSTPPTPIGKPENTEENTNSNDVITITTRSRNLALDLRPIWRARFGGELHMGRAIRSIKAILEGGGQEQEVKESFNNYAAKVDAMYASVEAWAAKWRAYCGTGQSKQVKVHDPYSD